MSALPLTPPCSAHGPSTTRHRNERPKPSTVRWRVRSTRLRHVQRWLDRRRPGSAAGVQPGARRHLRSRRAAGEQPLALQPARCQPLRLVGNRARSRRLASARSEPPRSRRRRGRGRGRRRNVPRWDLPTRLPGNRCRLHQRLLALTRPQDRIRLHCRRDLSSRSWSWRFALRRPPRGVAHGFRCCGSCRIFVANVAFSPFGQARPRARAPSSSSAASAFSVCHWFSRRTSVPGRARRTRARSRSGSDGTRTRISLP